MVALAVLRERPDTMDLEGFSNLGDSKIPWVARPGELAGLILQSIFSREALFMDLQCGVQFSGCNGSLASLKKP